MDDEWVLMESSLESSQSNSNNDYRPSLDFNRFSSMPAYAPEEDEAIVKDDSYISEQQQEREESVVSESEAEVDNIFNESPPVSDNEFTDLFEEQSNSIDITLGYNNTTAKQQVELHDNDESNNNKSLENNEPDMIIYLEQRPDESASFLSSSILNQQEQATRESLVDKHTIWKNSTLGSSVPYMSNHPSSPPPPSPPKAEHTNLNLSFIPGSSFLFNAIESTKPTKLDGDRPLDIDGTQLAERFKHLQLDLNEEQENDRLKSIRPIKQLKKRQVTAPRSFNFQSQPLPPFAGSPKGPPILSTVKFAPINIPPPPSPPPPEQQQLIEEENQLNQDTATIKENISNCLITATSESGQDQSASIFYELEQLSPITTWHQLKMLNLSRQNLTSISDLSTCFPVLEYLQISHNEIKSISGLPNSLIYLYASDNKLSEIDIYRLDKLQHLDISRNRLNTFQDMSRLKSLRVLDASHNAITTCKPFQNLLGLVSLSLKANCIRRLINFESMPKNNHLESLDVSFNRIECLDSIENLRYLRELNADHNDIKYIQLNQPMDRLCKLRLSFNRLKSFDVSPFPDIRILYLDDNQIQRIIGVACISRLDAFSLRDQGRQKVEYNLQYLRGTRKLYLSGSPFANMHRLIDFYSLEYLELCSAELDSLPAEFGKQVPNLSTLYLGINRLTDIRPLRRLKYLKRLVLVDNRLLSINEVIAVVQNLRQLHYLDLRQNPMCANIYPSMNLTMVQSANEREKISPYVSIAQDSNWEMQDADFLQTISEHWLTRRQVYRALFIQKCPKLIELDHITIDSNDRSEGDIVIGNFRKSYTPTTSSSQPSY